MLLSLPGAAPRSGSIKLLAYPNAHGTSKLMSAYQAHAIFGKNIGMIESQLERNGTSHAIVKGIGRG
jgi:hypothetical protein